MPWLPVLHSREDTVTYFRERLIPEWSVTLLLAHDVAAAYIATRPGWVDHLYVVPPCWRRGFGQWLLSLAKSRQDELQLWTFQGNAAARAFYAAQGFRECELGDGSLNEERTPSVRLLWRR